MDNKPSLLAQVQALIEGLYRQKTGVNFEHFLIGRRQFVELSEAVEHADDLADTARVFLRVAGNQLRIALYYADSLIRRLEKHDPRRGLNERNITEFAIFIEEINHAVHAAWKFLEGQREIGRESFLAELELIARVDVYFLLKYFLAMLNPAGKAEKMDKLWLRHHVFERMTFDYASETIAGRYRTSAVLGQRFARFVESLPQAERGEELARFRMLDFPSKQQYIACLPV